MRFSPHSFPVRFRARARLMAGTGLLAAPLAACLAGGVVAQTPGFAVEINRPAEFYDLSRVDLSLFGTTQQPASDFVRGCAGYVTGEASGAQVQVNDRLSELAFTVAGEGVKAMVLATPDGLFRCVLADESGYAAESFSGVEPGRYQIWAAGADGVALNARAYVSSRPVSRIELFGLDLDRLGEPRAGSIVFNASLEDTQTLVQGGSLVAEDSMEPLSPNDCWGYSGLDAPDAVLTLDGDLPQLSVFATSQRDLTLGVIAPDGRIFCNDDSYQLNPAVTIDGATSGDYAVFVGGFSQGSGDSYDLFARVGAPDFVTFDFNPDAEPRHGRVDFDMTAAMQGQLIGSFPVVAQDPFEALPTGGFCPGYGDLSAPGHVVSLAEPQGMISFYAQSATDLVLAVRDPNGAWYCNDDLNNLNPGVVIANAPAGDYALFVGAYSAFSDGVYDLSTAFGEPNWQGLVGRPLQGGDAPDINADAEPLLGSIEFGPDTLLDPRIILDVRSSVTDVFALGGACAGMIDLSAPDLTVSVTDAMEQLMIYMASDVDGTLAIVGPDGTLYCNDDFEMLNPGVVIQNPVPGGYRVFAGTYGGNGGLATLGVTRGSPLWTMDSVQ